MKYYDKENNRLVFVEKSATSEFWDNQWLNKSKPPKLNTLRVNKYDYVVRNTKKYLPQEAVLLERGCGNGGQVAKLASIGYKVIGLDYAEKTVNFLKQNYPNLNFTLGDVRDLPFGDEYFDGYWSFGVIEHFYDGYTQIANEMKRVIKKGGYLFLTFPHLSKLRRIKARKNKYPIWQPTNDLLDNFYQFALDENKVIENFTANGFELISMQHLDAIKGLKDENERLKNSLQKIYDNKGIIGTIGRNAIKLLFNKFNSHSVLCVCYIKRCN